MVSTTQKGWVRVVIIVDEAEGGTQPKYREVVVVMGDASEIVIVLTFNGSRVWQGILCQSLKVLFEV